MSHIGRAFVAAIVLLCVLTAVWATAPARADAASTWSDLSAPVLETYGLTLDDIAAMSSGYPDGTWRPDAPATRGQFVRFALDYCHMYMLLGGLVQEHFSDVPNGSPYFGWVEEALDCGLIRGYQASSSAEKATFGLNDPMTREQAVTIVTRYLSNMEPARFDYSAYGDARCQELFAPFLDKDQITQRQAVAMAIDTGVLRGSGTTLAPKASLTRIEAAALVARAARLAPPVDATVPPTYPDMTLSWLISDANVAGIQVEGAAAGSTAHWMPRTLWLTARVGGGQDAAVYQTTAEALVSLAEKYKEELKYEQVHVLLVAEGGKVVYDRTFKETAQTSSTTTTLRSVTSTTGTN